VNAVNQLRSISTFVWAYALFAFLLSFIREIIKDIQDMNGDMETGYRTLPVIWGITRARSIVAGMVVILIALIAASQWYLFNRDLMLVFWYLLIVVQALLVYLFIQLLTHKETGDYGFMSSTAKIIMVAGILSMELIYISM
jgi:4-hydroxybenzoate polyprenyltransferase